MAEDGETKTGDGRAGENNSLASVGAEEQRKRGGGGASFGVASLETRQLWCHAAEREEPASCEGGRERQGTEARADGRVGARGRVGGEGHGCKAPRTAGVEKKRAGGNMERRGKSKTKEEVSKSRAGGGRQGLAARGSEIRTGEREVWRAAEARPDGRGARGRRARARGRSGGASPQRRAVVRCAPSGEGGSTAPRGVRSGRGRARGARRERRRTPSGFGDAERRGVGEGCTSGRAAVASSRGWRPGASALCALCSSRGPPLGTPSALPPAFGSVSPLSRPCR